MVGEKNVGTRIRTNGDWMCVLFNCSLVAAFVILATNTCVHTWRRCRNVVVAASRSNRFLEGARANFPGSLLILSPPIYAIVSIRVCRLAEVSPDVISGLSSNLQRYYSTPPAAYYEIANQAADQYTPAIQPFHCDLVSRINLDTTVLEMGCGSAHLCAYVEKAGGIYTGVDHSVELLQKNRERFPEARFFPVRAELHETFDIVASLYTIEHIVNPPSYLETMWKFCRPGGLIAVICPDFVDGHGFPPSFYYGKTPRRFREKIGALDLGDVVAHLVDLFWTAPRWKMQARAGLPGAFWINTKPRIFHGSDYSIDADAVHLPRLRDLIWWLEKRGAEIAATSRSLPGVEPSILKYNCYVVARRPLDHTQ